jgi:hypothetical protein
MACHIGPAIDKITYEDELLITMPPAAINDLVAQCIEQAPQGVCLTMHITNDVISISHPERRRWSCIQSLFFFLPKCLSLGDKGMACNISLHLTSRHSSLRQLSVDELYTYLLISELISDHISRVASVDGLSQGAIRPQCD